MSIKIARALLIICLSVGLASLSFSQRQTGSIKGTITDTEGNLLPGVTVNISSGSLQGTLSYITSSNGSFRFPSLPPGVYTMTVQMQGFRTIKREEIVVNVGKTTEIRIQLEAAAIEEEITVVAESPTVDVESSKVSVSYTRDLLRNIPLARDLYDVVNSAPGAISEDVTYRRTSSIHGSTVRANQYAFDGINVTDPVVSYPMTNLNFDVYEEVEMETGGHSAEVGLYDGAYVNIVTKSGGNTFHGDITFYLTTEDFIGKNIPDDLAESLGLGAGTKQKRFLDFSSSVGGFIVRDRLWFFMNGRRIDYTNLVSGFDADVDHEEWFGFGKLTAQIASNLRLTATANYVDIYEPYFSLNVSPLNYPSSTAVWDHETGQTYLAYMNWIINQNAFLDIRAGYVNRLFPLPQQPDATARYFDIDTGEAWGSVRWGEEYVRKRFQANASFTYFKDEFLGGNHEVKLGLEFEKSRGTTDVWMEPDPTWFFVASGNPWWLGPNVGYILGIRPNYSINDLQRISFYAQDNFTIGRLTLNLGVRGDFSSSGYPDQYAGDDSHKYASIDDFFKRILYKGVDNLIVYNNIAPRAGLTFDLTGDGKTALKAYYGRIYQALILQHTGLVNPNYYSYLYMLWIDNNWNKQADPGTDTFQRLSSFGGGYYSLDPNLKQPYTDEYIVGIERELFRDLKVGLRGIYKREGNIIEGVYDRHPFEGWYPVDVLDPGEDGLYDTGDEQMFTFYDINYEYLAEELHVNLTNHPKAKRDYKAVEFTLSKRMSNNWQFLGSVIWSQAEGNIGQNYGFSWGGSEALADPNTWTNAEGFLNMDRTWQIKLQGTYQAPYGVSFSFYYRHFSGLPWTRTIRAMLSNYPNLGITTSGYTFVNAESLGSRRFPAINLLDLRVEKEFRIRESLTLALFLDAMNVLNSATFTYWNNYHGTVTINDDGSYSFTEAANWLKINNVSRPIELRFSARLRF
ncbi:MAG: carboxypeptidase regulatory-like domain-containing protein [Candidatus Aminicenantaceae bacterium]